MRYRHLLAKRSKTPEVPKPQETLAGHVLDVVAVADTLVRSWGDVFLRSMGLPDDWNRNLLSASLGGALLHDLGKANHQFQRLLRQGPDPPQAFRHEYISLYLLLRFPELDRWLFPEGDGLVRKAALFVALGHHLQIPHGSALSPRDGSGDPQVTVLTGHPEVADLLRRGCQRLGLSEPAPNLTDLMVDLLDEDPLQETRPWLRDANGWWARASPEQRRFAALAKALVIAADLAGSALPRTGTDAAAWVTEVLSRTCQPRELEALATGRLNGKPLRPFQTDVGASQSRITLVHAGCGSGKTTAAYLWLARRAAGRKLFFCYPTTGTATQGYADYVLPDDIDSALIHSRARVDLEDLRGAPDSEEDQQLRIEALAAWDVPLVVCTADTVLGLIQNNRRGLFSFPAIANGAFVFDEVHAYDDRLFASLLRFLEAFPGVLVLLMTASLPQGRSAALAETASRLGETLPVIDGPEELEEIPRYQVERSTDGEIWARVEQALSDGEKVLWVANTVDRAIGFGREALNSR